MTKSWLDLANQRNGYDNASVVLLRFQVSSPISDISLPSPSGDHRTASVSGYPSSQALLQNSYSEDSSAENPQSESADSGEVGVAPSNAKRQRRLVTLTGLLTLLVLLGAGGLVAWSQLDPNGFQQFRQNVFPTQPTP